MIPREVYNLAMNFLTRIARGIMGFIFPKSERVLQLEALSPGELLSALPPAEETGDTNTLAIFNYKNPLVRELIWEMKYRGNRRVAGKCASILFDIIQEEIAERAMFESAGWRTVLLVPVPISDKRRNERGYNQAEILCEEIKKFDTEQSLKYLPRQLFKYRHTESQTRTATKHERLENLKESMRVLHPPAVEGRCVILIDDVTTTGATFMEAKRALKSSGAKKILCIAVAH